MRGLAWLPGPPDVQLFINPAVAEQNRRQAIAFIDSVINTTNLIFCLMVATCQKHLVPSAAGTVILYMVFILVVAYF